MWDQEDRRVFTEVRKDLALQVLRLVVRVTLYALLGYLVVEFDLLEGVSDATTEARTVEVPGNVHQDGR